MHHLPWHGFYHSSHGFVTSKMKFLTTLALLLALQVCAPRAQVGGDATGKKAPGAAAAKEAAQETTGETTAARTVVCIDPGHPSEVASGRAMQHGTNETRVAWEVALKLREELEAKGYAVVLTKSAEDELVRNRDRAVVANRAGAALMVRLHCDASVERGFAVYYPDRQGKAKDGTSGPSAEVVEGSRRAATAIHA